MMTDSKSQTSLGPIAVLAGGSLVVMAIAALFAVNFLANAEAAIANREYSTAMIKLRMSIGGWLLILVTDVVVAWALYVYMQPVHRFWSLLAGWLRMVYAGILGCAIAFLLLSKQFLLQGDAQMENVLIYTGTFRSVWSFGLILFGLHLLVLGPLSLRSGTVPNWIGYLLTIAGVGYITVHLGHQFIPDFTKAQSILEMIFMIPFLCGELGLAVWLLIRGGKKPTIEIAG